MKKSIFDCKHIECCMDGCYCKIDKGSFDFNICDKPCKYWEKKPSEAYMTSPIGDLPINSKGLRIAIDEIVRLKRELDKATKETAQSGEQTAREIYRKGKELEKNFDMTGLGEYIMSNFLTISKES